MTSWRRYFADSAIGELAEPFDALLSEEIRLAAARRAHVNLIDAVEDVFRSADDDVPLGPGLALAGAARAPTTPAATCVEGLKEKILVDLGSHHKNRARSAAGPDLHV